MQKLLQLKKDYEREGFHLQRLYKRRIPDAKGIMRSTFGKIMQPIDYSEALPKKEVIDYEDLINKPRIESHELIHNKTFDDLGLTHLSNDELDDIFSL